MTAYLIKSILCLLVLWGFYKVALEQTAAHQFKRFYLLGSLVIAIALPLITFSYTVEVEPQPVITENFLAPTEFNNAPVVKPIAESTNWLLISLGMVYGAGVLLFGFRFLRNLLHLREKVRHNEHVKATSHINVLLVEHVIPHSFLKYIFLPKTDFKNNALPAEVLQHEQAHVIQKHSWDILFIEFLQVVFWFNPLLILLKKSVALNHEFLADQAAIQQENNITNYTNLLFNYSGGAHHTALSSPINYSLTKKRILMLSKTRSVKKLTTRIALFVPVLALCVYFFNQEIIAKPLITESKSVSVSKNANDSWTNIYLDFDKSIWIKDKKIKNSEFLQSISKLTKNEKYKVRLNVHSSINSLILNDLYADLREADVKNLIIHSIREPAKLSSNASENQIKTHNKSIQQYEEIKDAGVREQIASSYVWRVTWNNWGDIEPKHWNVDKGKASKEIEIYPVIDVAIDKNQTIYFDNTQVAVEDLDAKIETILKTTLKNTQPEDITLRLKVDENLPMGIMTDVKEKFRQRGILKVTTTTAQEQKKDNPIIAIGQPASIKRRISDSAQEEKVLKLTVTGSRVWLNEEETSVENFANDLDALSKDWTLNEKKNFNVHVRSSNPDKGVWKGLKKAFETTALYKANPKGLMPPPPPPAPAPPKASSIPAPPPAPTPPAAQTLPPPPPPPAPVKPESFTENTYNLLNIKLSNTKVIEVEGKATTITALKTFIEKNFQDWVQNTTEKRRGVIFNLPKGVAESQAHKAYKEIQDFHINGFQLKKEGADSDLLPPPPPPAPEEMVRLAKENIYYNNKKISAEKARELIKKKDQYDILLNSSKGSYVLIIKDK